MTLICPAGATNAQSGNIEDLGDFGPPRIPEYASQKNLVIVAYDPRTNTLLAMRGMNGQFSETPATNPNIIRSKDCGATWTQVADLISDEVIAPYGEFGGNLENLFFIPVGIAPGAEAGHWLIMDFVGGYYISTDDGETWSDRVDAGVGIVEDGGDFGHLYYGVVGISGQFDSRAIPLHVNLDYTTWGIFYIHGDSGGLGIRRSVGPNGVTDWETSLPDDNGWEWPGEYPTLCAVPGGWVAIVDRWGRGSVTGNVRRNISTDLDPSAWGDPFYVIDLPYMTDIYQGAATPTQRDFRFQQGHARMKFIPNPDHSSGGRLWMMGVRNVLLYSDDLGETWSNSLSDHTEAEGAMHPILNWRDSHDYTTRATTSRVLDIVGDPVRGDRLISVGVTYDREGITNRLAVFSCSDDGGDTWGSVGQLPLTLDAIQSEGTSAGADSPATARHAFPCLGGIS